VSAIQGARRVTAREASPLGGPPIGGELTTANRNSSWR
jgi:hypothetical protein